MQWLNKNYKLKKALILGLKVLIVAGLIYIVALPFYPMVKYKLFFEDKERQGITNPVASAIEQDESYVVTSDIDKENNEDNAVDNSSEPSQAVNDANSAPEPANTRDIKEGYDRSVNRVIIEKIGVNAPIIESDSAKEGLDKGSWRMPQSSTPAKGGNTVLTGHRFKYLPPHNLTFYLFHELEAGDEVLVIWEKRDYYYRITESKIVPATEVSILDPTEDPILTMFTCDPIYSTKNRLVIVSILEEVVF